MKRKITAAFLLAFFLLVGAEAVVRVFFARNMAGRFEYGYHPDAGFVEEGENLKLVRAGGRRFYPQTLKIQPEPGTFRIFVVGDSVPRGPNLEKAYAFQLQEVLKTNGIKAEAYNLCVPGYGAHRKHIVLSKALAYHPDLIILHVNASNEYEDEREYKRSQEFAGWHPKNWLMKSLVIRRLYEAKTEKAFWYLLPTEVRLQGAINDADAEIAAGLNEATRQRWNERVRQWTAKSISSTQDSHVPILLVAHASCADMKDLARPLNDEGLDAMVTSFRGPDIYPFSMKQALTGGDYAAIYADGSHMRAAGHQAMAEALAAYITTNGLIKSKK